MKQCKKPHRKTSHNRILKFSTIKPSSFQKRKKKNYQSQNILEKAMHEHRLKKKKNVHYQKV